MLISPPYFQRLPSCHSFHKHLYIFTIANYLNTTTYKMPLRIGVLLVDSVQLLDLAAVDLLYMTTPEYIAEIGMPKPLQELGRPCEIHYIGLAGSNNHSPVTSQMTVQLTDSLTDEAVAPGNLDILYLPGPPPKNMPPDKAYLDFVAGHDAAGTTVMTICTGILVAAYAGITVGKRATAPRFLIPLLKKQFPGALWDDSVRVVRDGNLWTSGMLSSSLFLPLSYFLPEYSTNTNKHRRNHKRPRPRRRIPPHQLSNSTGQHRPRSSRPGATRNRVSNRSHQ